MKRLPPPRIIRAWLYGIGLAIGALCVGYGIVTAEQAALWVALGAAVLVPNGLAVANIERDRNGVDRDPEQ